MADANHGVGYWIPLFVAAILTVFGLPIIGGGLWLISLGGSWYYAFAGLGLLVSAYFLFRHSLAGVSVYLLTFVGTLIWALWEAGLDGWAQVPRLVAPTVILVLVLLTIPTLRNRLRVTRGAVAAVAVGTVLVAGTILLTSPRGQAVAARQTLLAQTTPPPAPVPVPAPAETNPQPAPAAWNATLKQPRPLRRPISP